MEENKNKELNENQEAVELDLDDMEKCSGGGIFSDIPRVPVHKIDDELKDKI